MYGAHDVCTTYCIPSFQKTSNVSRLFLSPQTWKGMIRLYGHYTCIHVYRCSIPVILMGETGCGKTRLIRYMCDLAAHGATKHVQNMLIMKVT